MPRSSPTSPGTPRAAEPRPDALPRAQRTGGQQAARRIDRAALAAAYEAGDSTTDLARRHGVSNKTVSTMLKAAGVRLRSVAEARQVRAQNTWLHLDKPEPVHDRPEVEDVFGVVHRVVSLSLTDQGWAILRGYPVGAPSAPGIILTGELVACLERYRLQPGRIDLPLSPATLTRLRRKLALDWHAENRAWWEARRDELATAGTRDFAARHGATTAIVAHVRRKFHGRQRQPRSAWLDEDARTLILSTALSVDAIARTLGISPAYVYELRSEFTTGRRKGR